MTTIDTTGRRFFYEGEGPFTIAEVQLMQRAVKQAKLEILDDFAKGILPGRPGSRERSAHYAGQPMSFSELHDYVDANEYGLMTDEDYRVAHSDFDEFFSFYVTGISHVNAFQNIVDKWLAAGAPIFDQQWQDDASEDYTGEFEEEA